MSAEQEVLALLGAGRSGALTQELLTQLCLRARTAFNEQPMLLEISPPVLVAGDLHGQFRDLFTLFETGGVPPKSRYLFLGDYVDRGRRSVETISLLLALKLVYPESVFLLRGNHEEASINKIYGFFDECKRRFSVKLWKTFNDVFSCMPVAAIVGGRIYCAHGGFSPELESLDQIRRLMRPAQVADTGILCDILWSDPHRSGSFEQSDDVAAPELGEGWFYNGQRGVSYSFDERALCRFLSKFDLDLVCRAHEVVQDGYEFFGSRKLVTIFSAPNYCGEFDNVAALLCVDEDLFCSFKFFQSKPASKI